MFSSWYALSRPAAVATVWFEEPKGRPTLANRHERLMSNDTTVCGVPLRVVELTGRFAVNQLVVDDFWHNDASSVSSADPSFASRRSLQQNH